MQVRLNTIFYFILGFNLFIYANLFDGATKYLDDSSIIYYIVFSLCILITIIINGKRENVFLEMLIVVILFFYHLRIPMLLLPDIATTMTRISVSSSLVNNKIIELCYHYLALSSAIIILNPKIKKISCHFDKLKAQKVLLFVSAILLFHIVSVEFLSEGYGGRASYMGVFRIIPSIFTPHTAILVLVIYIVAAGKHLAMRHKYWAIGLVATHVVYACYLGSKAPIALLILYFIIAKMICQGPIVIKARDLIMIAISILLIWLNFFVANIARFYQRGLIDGEAAIRRIKAITGSFTNILYTVSGRLGYFDFYVESSENSLYLPYISIKYYFTSIVDKLTPGFDVFGVPYASRMFWYARNGSFPETGMHSDQMTLFGEASVIFSFFSIIMFFVMIMFFSFLAKRRPSKTPLMNLFYLAIIFHAYCKWLHGFGFDMFLCVDLIYNIVFFFCLAWFFNFHFFKRKKETIIERIE